MLDPITAAKLKSAHDAIGATIGADSDGPLSGRRTYLRGLVARTSDPNNVRELIQRRWPWADTAGIEKSAMGALTGQGDRYVAGFLDAIREQSVLGRIGFRQLPFRHRAIAATTGARGYWVRDGDATPLSKAALTGASLEPMAVSTILVQTVEAVENESHLVEAGLLADMETALRESIDAALLDPTNAGVSGESPSSIFYGAPTLQTAGPSADDLRNDVAGLFSAYAGRLSTAALILSPRTALQISLLQQPLGSTDLSATGGRLFGLPVFVSEAMNGASGGDWLGLVDASAAIFAMDDLRVSRADEALLECDDAPAGSSASPAAASANLVSLWQTNSIAWQARVAANWKLFGSGRAVLIAEADYSGEGSP